MDLQKRELYASSSGDRWYLARYPESGRVSYNTHRMSHPGASRSISSSRISLAAEGMHPRSKHLCA
jgi:hypothetical protein